MNKKIKLMSKTLLFSFLFSLFNPSCSLAMNKNMNGGKKASHFTHRNNGRKNENIDFDELVNSCIKTFFDKFGQNNYYNSYSTNEQRSYIDEIIGKSAKFKENLVEISKNIYNILLLCPHYSYNFKLDPERIISSSIIDLMHMYAYFIGTYSNIAISRKNKPNSGNHPVEFGYDFIYNRFLGYLMVWLQKIKTNNFNKNEYKNFKGRKEDFLGYCKQIDESISSITSIINDECVPEQVSSSQIFYCTEMFFQRLGELTMPDIAIISTFN